MSPPAGRAAAGALLVLVAGSGWQGCGSDTRPDGEPDRPAPRASQPRDVAAALEAARRIDLPEEEVRLDFGRLEAVHGAIGEEGFVETLEASIRDTAGDAYELRLRIVHRADPLSYHATMSRRAEGSRFDLVEQLIRGMEGRLPKDDRGTTDILRRMSPLGEREFIRIGERYWERSRDGWAGPVESAVYSALPEPTPMASLSRAFDQQWPPARRPEPMGEEVVNGRLTTRHRLEDPGSFGTLWNALGVEHGSPIPIPGAGPSIDAEGGGPSTTIDVWVEEHGLVLRADLRFRAANGDAHTATLEVGEFGEQPEIRPPPGR